MLVANYRAPEHHLRMACLRGALQGVCLRSAVRQWAVLKNLGGLASYPLLSRGHTQNGCRLWLHAPCRLGHTQESHGLWLPPPAPVRACMLTSRLLALPPIPISLLHSDDCTPSCQRFTANHPI